MAEVKTIGNIFNNVVKGIESGYSLIALQGSARSGKTRNVMIFIIMCCLNPKFALDLMEKNYANAMQRWQDAVDRGILTGDDIEIKKPSRVQPTDRIRVSIVRDTLPAIKHSVYNDDFVPVMEQMGIWNQKCMNMTDMYYRFPNGSVIEFFGSAGPEGAAKCKGPSRDILFCNEADALENENFKQLRMRTRMFTICDFNPSFTEEHWLYHLLSDWRTYHFISTFKDNPFLPTAIKEEIMSYKETAPALWEIYGLGHFAKVEGLVYPKETWDIVNMTDLPINVKLEERIGIDVGFSGSGDPTAVTLVRTANIDGMKHMWIQELIYEKGLNEKQMAYRLKPYNHIKKFIDSSNPLYIQNLEDNGIQLLFPVKKYANSIIDGITKVQSYKMHIISGSHNIEKEWRNYCWMKDRQGNYCDTPIDKWNHGADSVRYAISEDRTARGNHIKTRYSKRELHLGY